MEQIKKYNPPPNPAKETDTRFQGYIAKYGNESWELDALEPSVLDKLITKHINNLTDEKALAEAENRQEEEREVLNNIADNL